MMDFVVVCVVVISVTFVVGFIIGFGTGTSKNYQNAQIEKKKLEVWEHIIREVQNARK